MIEKNGFEQQTKICSKCGRLLQIEKFRLKTGQFGNPYYSGYCKDCEKIYDKQLVSFFRWFKYIREICAIYLEVVKKK